MTPKIRFSSLLLHERGLADAINDVYAFLVSWLGEERFTLQVSEIHLCVDIAGWALSDKDARCFISRATPHEIPDEEVQRFPEVTRKGRKVRAFEFSKKAPHSAIMYDKAKEVNTHHKEWFHEVWRTNGWNEEISVTRIEFRYERECLREMGIEEPYAMLDQLGGMWAYSSQKWLRHTVPTGDKNQTRWPVSELWALVQAVTFDSDAVPLVRQKKVELDSERAKAGFVGYATSWAVREVALHVLQGELSNIAAKLEGISSGFPLSEVQEDGGGFMAWAYDAMQDYLSERKAATFVEVMEWKAQLLGLPLAA